MQRRNKKPIKKRNKKKKKKKTNEDEYVDINLDNISQMSLPEDSLEGNSIEGVSAITDSMSFIDDNSNEESLFF